MFWNYKGGERFFTIEKYHQEKGGGLLLGGVIYKSELERIFNKIEILTIFNPTIKI